jgi:hypothetical protein
MAMNFPDSPSNGDTVTFNGKEYTYEAATSKWSPVGGGSASMELSDNAPANPSAGDMWYNTANGTMNVYYNDGSSSQWVGTSGPAGPAGPASAGGGGVTSYADITARNTVTANDGDLAFVSDSNTLYVYDGSKWDRIWAGPDELPTWTTELSGSVTLNADGTATTITVAATDPDGFDVTYTYDTSPSNQSQATIVNNNDGTFTLTPSTSESDNGDFTFRVKATDGIHVISTATNASLSFSDDITFTTDARLTQTANSTLPTTFTFQTQATSGTSGVPTNILGAGKKYFEVEFTGSTGMAIHTMMGIQAAGLAAYGWQTPVGDHIYIHNGTSYTNGTNSNGVTGFADPAIGDTFQYAYDSATGEAWFNLNNATWWPSNPASGAGRIYSSSGALPVFTLSSGSSALSTFNGTIKVGDDIIYTPPAGFGPH